MITTEFQFSDTEKGALAWVDTQDISSIDKTETDKHVSHVLAQLVRRLDQELKREIRRGQILSDLIVQILEGSK